MPAKSCCEGDPGTHAAMLIAWRPVAGQSKPAPNEGHAGWPVSTGKPSAQMALARDAVSGHPRRVRWKTVLSPIMGTKAERHAARERVSAYHQAQLGELLTHVTAAIDRYRDGESDAYTVDESIHHYHRAAGELWKFCFSRGGGSHAELIADVLDRMSADAETIDWWERATARRQ
jgi:hypothetical protein